MRMLILLCVIAAAPAAVWAQAQAREWPDPNSADVTGWYELAPGHKALMVRAPDGRELRLLDFDSVRFSRLVPTGDSGFLWKRGADSADRWVRFPRRASGDVAGFVWRNARGDSSVAPRAVEFPFDVHPVRFANDTVRLAGSLMVPRVRRFVGRPGAMREQPAGLPGAVIIHGSGASDRDNVWAYHFAQHLAREGIAVLLPDKRGAGASEGDWRTASFHDLAGDARAAATVLAQHPTVDSARVGFVGLSQGGWIAPLAATGAGAFAVNVSGAGVTPAQQVRHEIAQDLRRAAVPDSLAGRVIHLFDLAVAYSRSRSDSAWLSFIETRRALSGGPLADAVTPFPSTRDHWQWTWWHHVADFDPVPLWRSLPVPALVMYGELDAQDNLPVEPSVARLGPAVAHGHPANAVLVFPGLGHTLVDPRTRWISRTVLQQLSRWITENVSAR